MPTSCVISFIDNPAGVYHSGQTLSGKVYLTTSKTKSIRGIFVAIKGNAEVCWTETRQVPEVYYTGNNQQNVRTRTEIVYFTARNDYFNTRVNLLGNTGDNRFDLLPGSYEYTFQMQLPDNIPSSFIGQYGVVRYQVCCTIDRPWHFDNVFKFPFTVIAPLDLNANPIYRKPLDITGEKTFSKLCCCGDGGNILVQGTIPCGGFVPGQIITFPLYIKNEANVTTSETKIQLTQMVEYRCYTPYPKSQYEYKKVTENRLGSIERYQNKQFNCTLPIPSIAPNSLQTCAIINITYYIEIKLKIQGMHSNLNIKLPITIGTVPLFPQWKNRTDAGMQDVSVAPSAPEGLPPSYEEAVHLGPEFDFRSEEDKYVENVSFQPRYPVYNNLPSPNVLPPHYDASSEQTSVITTQPENGKERY